jgi:predicted ABC-type ATPase
MSEEEIVMMRVARARKRGFKVKITYLSILDAPIEIPKVGKRGKRREPYSRKRD